MLIVFSFIYYDLWAAVKNKKGQPEPATHSIESREAPNCGGLAAPLCPQLGQNGSSSRKTIL